MSQLLRKIRVLSGIAGEADLTSFQSLFVSAFLGSLVFTPGRVNAFGSRWHFISWQPGW